MAALREVQEEAGVKGTLGRLLGVFEVILPSFTVVEFIGDHCQTFPEDLIENFSWHLFFFPHFILLQLNTFTFKTQNTSHLYRFFAKNHFKNL